MKIFRTIAAGDSASWTDLKANLPSIAPVVGTPAVPAVPAVGSVYTFTIADEAPVGGVLTFSGFNDNSGPATMSIPGNNQVLFPAFQAAFSARYPGIQVTSQINPNGPGTQYVLNYPSTVVYPPFPTMNSTLVDSPRSQVFDMVIPGVPVGGTQNINFGTLPVQGVGGNITTVSFQTDGTSAGTAHLMQVALAAVCPDVQVFVSADNGIRWEFEIDLTYADGAVVMEFTLGQGTFVDGQGSSLPPVISSIQDYGANPIAVEWDLTSNFVPGVAAVPAGLSGPYLVYAIRGATVLDLIAVDNGTEYTTSLTVAQSKLLVPGVYSFQCYFTDSLTAPTQRFTISRGTFNVTPDLSTATAGFDGRSQAEKDLASVQAAIRAIAAGGAISSYMIAGRSVQYRSMADLITLESKLKYQVLREKKADKIKNGEGNPFASYVRFK